MYQNRYCKNSSRVSGCLLPPTSFKETSSTCPLNQSTISEEMRPKLRNNRRVREREFLARSKWKIVTISIGIVSALGVLVYLYANNVKTLTKFNFKDHKNFEKFGTEKCNFNYTINPDSDANTDRFPWLVRIIVNDGTVDNHSCTGFIISGK